MSAALAGDVAGAASYAYDPLGRLVGMVAADGAVARWSYDANGNVTAVTRLGTPPVAVLSAVPKRVRPGQSITLYGKGFSATAASNTVKINGTAAAVTKADATQLVVTVPAAATSGAVDVTSPAGTANLAGITVIRGDLPVVTSFAPTVARAGDTVTAQVTNPDPTPANNLLLVNGVQATITARSATSLTFTVPPGAGSGRVTVRTPAGSGSSTGDLVIVPDQFDVASVNPGSRITVGTKTSVTVPAGKVLPKLFDAADGERFAVVAENGTVGCLGVYLYDPRQVNDTSNGCLYTPGWVETSPITDAGTRTLFLRNTSSSPATLDVTVIKVPADVNLGAIATNGTAKTASIASRGQNGYLTFNGTSGQQIAVRSSDHTFPSPAVRWGIFTATGTRVGGDHYGNDWQDAVTLPSTGAYQIRIDPQETATGSITFKAWVVAGDANLGALMLNGTAKTATLTNPGQNAYLTFAGTAGQRVALRSSDVSESLGCCNLVWGLFSPDGNQLGSTRYGNQYQDTVLLPETGTYQIRLDPYQELIGSIVFRGWLVPADANLGALTTNGTAKPVALSNPGQNGYVTFTATAGQRVAVESSATTDVLLCCSLRWWVTTPEGNQIGSTHYGNDFQDAVLLPTAGTYRVRVDLDEERVGGTTFKAWVVSGDANLGTLSLNGTAKVASLSNPGQNGYLTFAGTAGQRVALRTTDTSESLLCCYVTWGLYGPDGQMVGNSHYGNDYQDTVVLPSTGTYQIRLNPDGSRTGSISVRGWSVPADVNLGAIATNGTAKVATITNPGQDGYLTFTGTAGQRIAAQTSSPSEAFGCCDLIWGIYSPDGDLVGSTQYSVDFQDTVVLPASGTYQLRLAPREEKVGSVTAKVWLVPADANLGALPTDGTAKVATISTTGQNGYLTFTATTGRAITITGSNSAASFDCCYVTWSVRRPNGSVVTSRSGDGPLTFVPDVNGTHRLYINPDEARTGSITFAASQASAVAAAKARKAQARAAAKQKKANGSITDRVERRDPRTEKKSQPDKLPPDPFKDQLPTAAQWHPDEGNTSGVDWLTRRKTARAEDVQPLQARAGVTAVNGLVLDLDGRPLSRVTVRTATASTKTDARGRFLLEKVSPNASFIVVDGRTANTRGAHYGTFRIRVRPKEGRTVGLDATMWMPRLDLQHTQELAAPTAKETVLTTPDIPGLEVRIPAGSVVKDVDGKVVTELGITAIPLDRPPFPLPRNGIVPVYFTIQPGGGSIFPQGAQVVYPNYTGLSAGTVVDFYNYDPAEKGWYVYGHGKVSADGQHVLPDEKTRIWNLDGSMFNTSGNPKPDKNWWDDFVDWISGDPVDLSTGLMTDRQTDLAVSDTLPITVTRSYWQGDGRSRDFGLNQGADYNMFLGSENQYQEVDLYLPGGGKVHYVRTSPGTGYSDAVFGAVNSPGQYQGSTVAQISGDWVLSLRDGTKWFFPYYSRARMMRDRNGNTVTFTRAGGSNGEVTRMTSPNGRWISLEYDGSNRVASATDNIGRTVSYTYDESGRLSTVTDVAGKVRTYAYDTSNRITSIKDARGTTYLSVTYDANGRVNKQTVAGGGIYTFAYVLSATGTVTETRVTQPNGSVRRVVFNADGVATSDTQAYGTTLARATTYTRDTERRVTAVTDPFGRKTAYGYDASGNITSTTVLSGTSDAAVVAKATYGAFDLPQTTTDAVGKVTSYSYDAQGNLTSLKQPTGWTTKFTYRSDGQVATVTDTAGKTTTMRYTGGALSSTTDPLNRVSRQFVDAAGRVVSATDPMGATTQTTFDVQNQATKVVDALGGSTAMVYDANGNLTQLTDPRGGISRWTYDAANRPVTAVDPLTKTTAQTYDTSGRMTSVTARSGLKSTIAYDALGRVTVERYGVTATGQQATVTSAYDNRDRLATLTDTTGGTTSFAYDVRDRLTSTTGPKGTVTYAYDAASRATSMKAGSAAAVTYTYNDASQLVGITQGTVAASIAHDAAGRTSAVTLPHEWKQQYAYDDAGQITGITYTKAGAAKGGITYAYDAGGRNRSVGGSLANSVLPGARSGLVYDAANRLTKSGTTALTYDADGNLTNDGATTYQWDARGQLIKLSRTGLTGTFTYDGLGERTSRTVGSSVTGFLNDGSSTASELTSTGSVSATLLAAGTDEWLARTSSGTTDAILTDAAGSPVALGAADGSLAAKYSYDPYGVSAVTGSPRGSDLGFTGRQDDGTGLMYYRARYYSPTLQRFISQDPIGMDGGLNLYGYAAQSPTNFTDPTGHNPLLIGCAVGAGVDAGISYVSQRLSGQKVDWGWNGVGGAALTGCATGMLGGALEGLNAAKAVTRLCNCFPAGTPVQTEEGAKPIEQVKVGDRVWAKDLETGEPELRRVTGLFDKPTEELVDLDVGGTTVQVTPDHPFWVEGKGWTEAGDLQVGDRLADRHGSGATVEAVDRHPAQTRVYNFQVEGDENYYVSDAQLLVHNCAIFPGLSRASQYGLDSYKNLRKAIGGTGLQAHHLLEKRFATALGQKPREMLSIAVTPAEHQIFTNAWRQAIPYGTTANASTVENAARSIYANYPAILSALGL